MTGGPRRRVDDHVHTEYWTTESHRHFEARLAKEIEALERAVNELTARVTLMLGGLAFVAFLIPIISPFIRAWLNLDVPSTQR